MPFFQIRSIPPEPGIIAGSGLTDPQGPLADLNKPDFNMDLYKYPISAANADAPDNMHEIIFYINVPQSSSWNTGPQSGPQPVSNRYGNATNFGLRNETGGLDTGSEISWESPYAAVFNRKTVRTQAAISLYIPQTMVYSQNMHYDNISLADALGFVGLAGAGVDAIANRDAVGAGASLMGILPSALRAFGLPGASAAQALNKVGLSILGLADNPQNFLLFKQIDFRHFQFDFLLTPENANEAQIIQEIIYLFRFHSVPEVKTGTLGRFFIPPSDFDIDVLHNGAINTHLPKISTCILNSVSVDYCASGQWGAYYTGDPLQTRLTLDFTETSILTKDLVSGGF